MGADEATMIFCKSCGERYSIDRTAPKPVRDLMQDYCLECATEIAGREIPSIGTLQHGSGGGQRVIRSPRGLS